MQSMKKKDMKVKPGDQSQKIDHKGAKVSQGQDYCSPSHLTEKTYKPGSDKMKLNKGTKLPTEGPFSNPGQGKDQGSKSAMEPSRESLMPMKDKKSRNSK